MRPYEDSRSCVHVFKHTTKPISAEAHRPMSTPLEKELTETKAQLTISTATNADLQDAITYAQAERDVALVLRHDAYDMFEAERKARRAAEAELTYLRAAHAATLQELDDLVFIVGSAS